MKPDDDAVSTGEDESSSEDELSNEDESETSEEEGEQPQSNVDDQVAAHIKKMGADSRTVCFTATCAKCALTSSLRQLLEPMPSWHTTLLALQYASSDILAPTSPKYTLLLKKAQTLHERECESYNLATHPSKLTASSSDAAFLQRVLTSGTLSDRLSALTLLVQSSPVHNIKALETLKGMSSKKGREESLKALRATVDWWVGGGAPDRKLR
jgi:ribosome biogenesis protein MAK21